MVQHLVNLLFFLWHGEPHKDSESSSEVVLPDLATAKQKQYVFCFECPEYRCVQYKDFSPNVFYLIL